MALDDALVEEIKKQSHEIGNAIWENIRQHCVSFKDKMSNAISEPHFL